MLTLDVQVDGFDELLRDVARAGGDAQPLANAATANSAYKIQSNVRDRAPHRTGALQRSILVDTAFPAATISVNESYGEFVEYGTAPHVIEPVNKKALFWKGALSPYRRVMHPGTKAKPFFWPGVDDSQDYVTAQFTRVIERLVSEMAGH